MRHDALRTSVIAFLSILAPGCMAIEPPSVRTISPPATVLFVGNSLSYYNDGLHTHVANLLRAAGKYQEGEMRLRLMTISGSYLSEHRGGLESLVTPGAFDAVVMHGYSNEPIDPAREGEFRETARSFIEYARERGVTPVLLMTWGYEGEPGMSERIQAAYTSTGNELNALVIPVGRAFDLVTKKYPEVELHKRDIAGFEGTGDDAHAIHKKSVKHPSLAGTYLAACVVYATLWGSSPVGLPYRSDLDPDTSARLQAAAAETVVEYFDRPLGGSRD